MGICKECGLNVVPLIRGMCGGCYGTRRPAPLPERRPGNARLSDRDVRLLRQEYDELKARGDADPNGWCRTVARQYGYKSPQQIQKMVNRETYTWVKEE